MADFTGNGWADVLLSQTGGSLVRWYTTIGGNGLGELSAAPGFDDLIGNDRDDVVLQNESDLAIYWTAATGSIWDQS